MGSVPGSAGAIISALASSNRGTSEEVRLTALSRLLLGQVRLSRAELIGVFVPPVVVSLLSDAQVRQASSTATSRLHFVRQRKASA
jgi:hypothetical protein